MPGRKKPSGYAAGGNTWKLFPAVLLAVALNILLAAVSFLWDYRIFLAELAVSVVVLAVVLLRYRSLQKDLSAMVSRTYETLNATEKRTLMDFPMPAVVTSEDGSILWYNDLFRRGVLSGGDAYGMPIGQLTASLQFKTFESGAGRAEVAANGRRFTVFGNKTPEGLFVFYWIDDTALKETAEEYQLSRPVVAVIVIDNYDELMQNAREGEKSVIIGLVEKEITAWVSTTTGFLRRLDRDRFLLVFEERHLRKAIETRFSVLDAVRLIVTNDRMPATLSIGVGRGGQTFSELEDMARQALDMALGRGGDQAAVRSKTGFEFYGGTSKAVEKRTRVKTRIIASALAELVEGSDNVLIMGHRGADLDVVGAASSLYKAVISRGREAHVVINRRASPAGVLIDRLEAHGYRGAFIGVEEALPLVTRRTLLIVVDTHRKNLLESLELYRAVKTVVVIDHHRKMVDFIDNAVIFYHEPFSSSTSEMVAELVQYIADQSITNVEADAMMAGITLDTRNFTVRTGVRTFEAAAYLRRKGADTASVRLLFAGSMRNFEKRASIVTKAEIYKGCAISISDDEDFDDMRIVAPQAADELLTIEGVSASFVAYRTQDGTAISARSMGRVNVQLIMEELGGGGHQAMAGAQIADVAPEATRTMIHTSIDKYFTENRG